MIVNLALVDDMLSPLVGGADDDELVNRFQGIDHENELQVKMIIREIIKPEFESNNAEYKTKAKIALAYCLVSSNIDFMRIFQRNLMPFDHPKHARDFFVWLWQELFNNEIIKLDHAEQYKSIDDPDALNRRWKEDG